MRKIKRTGIILVLAGMFAGSAQAILWDNDDGDGLWSNATNWYGNVLPLSTDDASIGHSSGSSDPVTVDYASAVANGVRMYSSSTLTITNGGTLTASSVLYGGYTAGNNTVNIDGGTYTSGTYENNSGTVRLGNVASANSVLNILNGGSFYTHTLYASYNEDGTGKINLLDGTLELWRDADGALNLDADGTMEIGVDGDLTIAGDRVSALQGYEDDGYLFGTGGADLTIAYNTGEDETHVTMIPEPATISLFALTGLGVILLRRITTR